MTELLKYIKGKKSTSYVPRLWGPRGSPRGARAGVPRGRAAAGLLHGTERVWAREQQLSSAFFLLVLKYYSNSNL